MVETNVSTISSDNKSFGYRDSDTKWLSLLSSPDLEMRQDAVACLAPRVINSRRVREVLVRRLAFEQNVGVRRSIIGALAQFPLGSARHAVRALGRQLGQERDVLTRELIVSRLRYLYSQYMHSEIATYLLEQLTREQDQRVQIALISVLGRCQYYQALPTFRALLQSSPAENVAVAIAHSLGQIGGNEARIILQRLVAEPNPSIQQEAQTALALLEAEAGRPLDKNVTSL